MDALPRLRVIKHAENGAKNIQVFLHFGIPVTFNDGENEAEATAQDRTEYVRFSFEGEKGAEAGARVRIEIRSDGGIVYREEAQIQVNGAPHKGTDRSFRVEGPIPGGGAAQP